jgi:hypothetical protein
VKVELPQRRLSPTAISSSPSHGDLFETAKCSGPQSCVTSTLPRNNDIEPEIGGFEHDLRKHGWQAISSDKGLRWLVIMLLLSVATFAFSDGVGDWYLKNWWWAGGMSPAEKYKGPLDFMLCGGLLFMIAVSLLLLRRIYASSDDPAWGTACLLVVFLLASATYYLAYHEGYGAAPNLRKPIGMSIGATVSAGFASPPAEKNRVVEPVENPGPTPQELDFILGKHEKP